MMVLLKLRACDRELKAISMQTMELLEDELGCGSFDVLTHSARWALYSHGPDHSYFAWPIARNGVRGA